MHLLTVFSLNHEDLSDIKGEKLYYNKKRASIHIVVYTLLLIAFVLLAVGSIGSNKLFLFAVWILIFLYLLQEALSRLLLKHPILVVSNNDRLFYTHTKRWYKMREHKFVNAPFGRYRFVTFCMYDENNELVFSIKNSHVIQLDSFFRKSPVLKNL